MLLSLVIRRSDRPGTAVDLHKPFEVPRLNIIWGRRVGIASEVARFQEDHSKMLKHNTIQTYDRVLRPLHTDSWVRFDTNKPELVIHQAAGLIREYFSSDRAYRTKKVAFTALRKRLEKLQSESVIGTEEISTIVEEERERLRQVHENTMGVKRRSRYKKTISEKRFKVLVKALKEEVDGSRPQGPELPRLVLLWIHFVLVTGARPVEIIGAHWSPGDSKFINLPIAKERLKAALHKSSKPPVVAFRKSGLDLDYGEVIDCTLDVRYAGLPVGSKVFPGDINYRCVLVDEKYRLYVDAFLRTLREFLGNTQGSEREAAYTKLYDSCRGYLRGITKKIWPHEKNLRLYTFRSQFSANMKALYGDEITRTLMGHTEDSASTNYYGKACHAHSAFKGQRPTEFDAEKFGRMADRQRSRERG